MLKKKSIATGLQMSCNRVTPFDIKINTTELLLFYLYYSLYNGYVIIEKFPKGECLLQLPFSKPENVRQAINAAKYLGNTVTHVANSTPTQPE